MDHEWWFAGNNGMYGLRRGQEEAEARALRICGGCQVRVECLDDAVSGRLEFGIFGGLTAQQRAGLIRRGRRRYTFKAR